MPCQECTGAEAATSAPALRTAIRTKVSDRNRIDRETPLHHEAILRGMGAYPVPLVPFLEPHHRFSQKSAGRPLQARDELK